MCKPHPEMPSSFSPRAQRDSVEESAHLDTRQCAPNLDGSDVPSRRQLGNELADIGLRIALSFDDVGNEPFYQAWEASRSGGEALSFPTRNREIGRCSEILPHEAVLPRAGRAPRERCVKPRLCRPFQCG